MPGHKGKNGLWNDLTEIAGADELFCADGIINESENNASALFGTAHSYYSTEGSTLAIKAMLTLAAGERPAGERPLFVAARNVHKAFVYGAALLDADVEWIFSESPHICKCEISARDVEKAVKNCRRKPDGVYITSPDYLGNIADVKGIAEACDALGVPLLVDNAHGAYLAFLEENIHPMALGASMCADSAHKTLPVLTGGAYLHISKKAERFCEKAREAMAIYASTSPSYLILESLDKCNKHLARADRKAFFDAIGFVSRMRERLAARGIVCEGDEPLKLTINAAKSGYEGDELAAILRKNGIEPEFCDSDYAVLMVSEYNSREELAALENALASLVPRAPVEREEIKLPKPQAVISIRNAVFAPSERVSAKTSEGRICASVSVSCPPAVPIAISGEIIDFECVKAFERYKIESVSVLKK